MAISLVELVSILLPSPPRWRVVGCGAAEATGLGFFCFVLSTLVLSAKWVDFGFFFWFINLPILRLEFKIIRFVIRTFTPIFLHRNFLHLPPQLLKETLKFPLRIRNCLMNQMVGHIIPQQLILGIFFSKPGGYKKRKFRVVRKVRRKAKSRGIKLTHRPAAIDFGLFTIIFLIYFPILPPPLRGRVEAE